MFLLIEIFPCLNVVGLTTKAIREFNNSIPIIALTASASTEMQNKAIETGMNDYISKPFNPNDLYSTIFKYTTGKTKAV